ncbi:helix-turn-helix transcriptional regulator [Zongyangia hominis]|uniref:YafY family transcriptional regulator n=1 Tax=Zongyangia hominis TaxID=2763677 RepID=A0A926IBM3_9FIRM|nr:YafY family protein [Zongyangia hominis]MBC8570332.1 YafY family transcriptional regulator [Zongyangia hominis]
MQIHRLFEMVYLLLGRRRMTARELAERFEVSERTIYRDVDALSAAGIPIYTVKGKGGGIALLDDFVLNKSLLSPEEQTEILSALEGLHAVSGQEGERLLGRLSALFQREESGWLDLDFSHWGSSPEEKERFGQLKAAILQHRRILFDYDSAVGERTRREAEPVQLCLKSRVWYLKAYCLKRESYRLFRVSRLHHLTVTDTLFSPRPQPPPPLEAPYDGKNPPPTVRLKVWVAPHFAYRVLDDFSPEMVKRREDGSLLITACFPMDNWVTGYFLSYGDGALVLEPDWLRRELAALLHRTLALYEEAPGGDPAAE